MSNNNIVLPQAESPNSSAIPIMDEEELQLLYTWVDDIPLSRPKKNIARDFSDGVLMAEIVKHFFPKLVQLHNYSTASSYTQKLYNWNTLNRTQLPIAVAKHLLTRFIVQKKFLKSCNLMFQEKILTPLFVVK